MIIINSLIKGDNMLDFYESILNITKYDKKDALLLLEKTIKSEVCEVRKYVNEMSGLCKVISNNIKIKLNDLNFKVYMVNIKELFPELKEHVFLISSFKDSDSNLNYFLIDTTYGQFCYEENKILLDPFKSWPSENLKKSNEKLLNELLSNGYSFIDDNSFKEYLGSFTSNKVLYSLDNIILGNYGGKYETNKQNVR